MREVFFVITAAVLLLVNGCCKCSKNTPVQEDSIAVSTPEPAPAPQAATVEYTIVEGDSLWSIAKDKLGDGTRYKEILELNPDLQIETLKIGSTIKIPAK